MAQCDNPEVEHPGFTCAHPDECAVCGEHGTLVDPLVDWAEGLAHEMCGYDREWVQV